MKEKELMCTRRRRLNTGTAGLPWSPEQGAEKHSCKAKRLMATPPSFPGLWLGSSRCNFLHH